MLIILPYENIIIYCAKIKTGLPSEYYDGRPVQFI